jgi:predicted metal-dependent hydrolase
MCLVQKYELTIRIYHQNQHIRTIKSKLEVEKYQYLSIIHNMIPEYTLIRSKRKSIALQVTHEGRIIVRSPLKINISFVENFIMDKIDWIKKHQIKIQSQTKRVELSAIEIESEKERLKQYIIPRIHELYFGKNLPKITSIKITKSE